MSEVGCAVCDGELPELAIECGDDYCSTECARSAHGYVYEPPEKSGSAPGYLISSKRGEPLPWPEGYERYLPEARLLGDVSVPELPVVGARGPRRRPSVASASTEYPPCPHCGGPRSRIGALRRLYCSPCTASYNRAANERRRSLS